MSENEMSALVGDALAALGRAPQQQAQTFLACHAPGIECAIGQVCDLDRGHEGPHRVRNTAVWEREEGH